jgi:hypothetical protein
MRKVTAICASIIGLGALLGVLLAQGGPGDVALAQDTGGGGAMPGGGMMGGMGMSGMPGMGGGTEEEAAPAVTVTTTRHQREVGAGEDVVVDVVNGATLQLQNGVDGFQFVRLDGVVLPREYVRMRSDWALLEGSGDPWDWRRHGGLFYEEAISPDIETYREGDDELRAFVMNAVVNKTVRVEKVGDFLQANGQTIPAVRVTYQVPQVMLGQDTGPFDLNEQVIAETKALGLWNCMWDDGKPKEFDCSTQSWAD